MRKPVSKHALRRAMEQVQAEGHLTWNAPTGSVVDRLWHHMSRAAYHDGARRKPATRDTPRRREAVGV
jgi:hypothetical protein